MVLSFSISWKFPKGIIGSPSLITPAIFEVTGNLRSLIGAFVTFELPFTTNSIISASTPCRFDTEDTFPFLTNLKILLAAIIFFIY
jgi:hypothetical protein